MCSNIHYDSQAKCLAVWGAMKETRPAKMTVHRGEQSLSAKVWFENGNRTDIATNMHTITAIISILRLPDYPFSENRSPKALQTRESSVVC